MTPFGMITAGATREDNGKGQPSSSSNNCQCCYDLNGIRTGYKYQVGVEFEIINEDTEWCFDCGEIALDDCHENNHRRGDKRLKFLPLRQKVEGDDSILLVTKVNYNEK